MRDLASLRSSELVQPAHLFATLCHWFNLELDPGPWRGPRSLLEESPAPWPELAVSAAPGQWALRTPAWLARLTALSDDKPPDGLDSLGCELFLKPDDRWDFNDVADRCPDVVQAFQRLLKQLRTCGPQADWSGVLPLEETLLGGG